MSTPAVRPEKKEKKSKKRAREEAQDTSAQPVVEQSPAKKHKKSKKESPVEVKEVKVEEAQPEIEEVNAMKKQKKQKKVKLANGSEHQPEVTDLVAPATTESQSAERHADSTAFDKKLLESKSPFTQQTVSFYLSLSSVAHNFPLEGLCAEHISPLLLTYYPPLKGVVLSYSNPRLSEDPSQGVQIKSSREVTKVFSKSVDEYAVTFIWLTAEFVTFRSVRGSVLEGYVNLQNESILGLICYNYFNAGIERSRLPSDWQWVEDEAVEGDDATTGRRRRKDAEGHFVDGHGNKVEGKIVFKVKDFEASAGAEMDSGSINIYGTLLGDEDDAKLDAGSRQDALVRGRPSGR